jgi:hypothetical protein
MTFLASQPTILRHNFIFLWLTFWLHFVNVISKLKIWTSWYTSTKISHLIHKLAIWTPLILHLQVIGKYQCM